MILIEYLVLPSMSLSPAIDIDNHLLRFWQLVISTLEKKIPSNQFKTWLEPLSCAYSKQVFQSPMPQMEEKQTIQNLNTTIDTNNSDTMQPPIQNKKYINIYAPNSFKIDYAKRNFLSAFDQAAQNIWPQTYIHFQFLVADKELIKYQQNNSLIQTSDVRKPDKNLYDTVYDKPYPGRASNVSENANFKNQDQNQLASSHSADDEIFSAFGLERIQGQGQSESNHQANQPPPYEQLGNATTSRMRTPPNQNQSQQTNDIYEISKLNPALNFENFIQGQANTLARSAAVQIARDFQKQHPVCVFYGAVGLGKTHLIQAIGNHIAQHKPHSKIRYIHAEQFVSDVVKSYQKKTFNDLKKNYHMLNVLLIDDIQFLAGKQKTQEEFFHMFEHLMNRKALLILTTDAYPKNLKDIDTRLVSRFLSGLNIAIHPPELEMRIAILKNKAQAERFNLPDDVAFFIANQLKSNVRELEGALRKFMVFHQFQPDITPSLHSARLALMDIIPGLENMVFDLPTHVLEAPKKRKKTTGVRTLTQKNTKLLKTNASNNLNHLNDAGDLDDKKDLKKIQNISNVSENQPQSSIISHENIELDLNLSFDFGYEDSNLIINTHINDNKNFNKKIETNDERYALNSMETASYLAPEQDLNLQSHPIFLDVASTNQNSSENNSAIATEIPAQKNKKRPKAQSESLKNESSNLENTDVRVKKLGKTNPIGTQQSKGEMQIPSTIAQTLSFKQPVVPNITLNHDFANGSAIFGLGNIQNDIKEQQNQAYYYISQIQQLVAKFYQLTVDDLISKKRQAKIALARQVAIFFAKKLTECSLNEIAQMFGGRDHTTILHSIKKIQALYIDDIQIKQQIDCLLPSIKSYLNLYY